MVQVRGSRQIPSTPWLHQKAREPSHSPEGSDEHCPPVCGPTTVLRPFEYEQRHGESGEDRPRCVVRSFLFPGDSGRESRSYTFFSARHPGTTKPPILQFFPSGVQPVQLPTSPRSPGGEVAKSGGGRWDIVFRDEEDENECKGKSVQARRALVLRKQRSTSRAPLLREGTSPSVPGGTRPRRDSAKELATTQPNIDRDKTRFDFHVLGNLRLRHPTRPAHASPCTLPHACCEEASFPAAGRPSMHRVLILTGCVPSPLPP